MTYRDPLVFGHLVIDLSAWEVRHAGELVDLTRTEFEILAALASRPREVVTDGELTSRVWGENWFGDEGNLAVHVSKLRHKLGESGTQPRYISTVRGVGYRFEPGRTSASDVLTAAYDFLRRDPEAVEIVAEPDLTIAKVATHRSDVLGWSASDLIGREAPFLADHYANDAGAASAEIEARVAKGLWAWSGTVTLPRADGDWVPTEFVTRALIGSEGVLAGIRTVLREAGGGVSAR